MNDWLRSRALRNQEQGFTVTMVVHEAQRVVGFYGLALRRRHARHPSIDPDGSASAAFAGDPAGQLAVDRNHRGRGIGDGLLSHALARCAAAAELIGGRAVVVNAIDADAEGYWRSRGFIPAKDDPRTLFRSIEDIRRSLSAAR